MIKNNPLNLVDILLGVLSIKKCRMCNFISSHGTVVPVKMSCFRYHLSMEKYPYLNEAVGKLLQKRRLDLGMSKRQLSLNAMIERAYITSLENGKGTISLNALLYLCEALDLKPDEFVRQVMEEISRKI